MTRISKPVQVSLFNESKARFGYGETQKVEKKDLLLVGQEYKRNLDTFEQKMLRMKGGNR